MTQLITKVFQANDMGHALDEKQSREIPCIAPSPESIRRLAYANELEHERANRIRGTGISGATLSRSVHLDGSTMMTRVDNMIKAHGQVKVFRVKKNRGGGANTVEEAYQPYPTDEAEKAKKWLSEHAADAAIYLVINRNAREDFSKFLKTDKGKEEAVSWSEQQLIEAQDKFLWLLETKEETEKRKALLEKVNGVTLEVGSRSVRGWPLQGGRHIVPNGEDETRGR